jgi:hypothetical protein
MTGEASIVLTDLSKSTLDNGAWPELDEALGGLGGAEGDRHVAAAVALGRPARLGCDGQHAPILVHVV